MTWLYSRVAVQDIQPGDEEDSRDKCWLLKIKNDIKGCFINLSMEQINKYQNGKIYKIWSLECDEIYVGSTCSALYKRMSKHRRTCKIGVKNPNCKLYQEMKRIGEDAFKIELIENYSCTCIDELLRREGYWIRELNATLNMRIAGRKQQEYYNEHIEEIKEYRQKYRIDHEDNIKATNKRYYQQNREV